MDPRRYVLAPAYPTHPNPSSKRWPTAEDWESAPSSAVGPLPWDTTEVWFQPVNFLQLHENGKGSNLVKTLRLKTGGMMVWRGCFVLVGFFFGLFTGFCPETLKVWNFRVQMRWCFMVRLVSLAIVLYLSFFQVTDLGIRLPFIPWEELFSVTGGSTYTHCWVGIHRFWNSMTTRSTNLPSTDL